MHDMHFIFPFNQKKTEFDTQDNNTQFRVYILNNYEKNNIIIIHDSV